MSATNSGALLLAATTVSGRLISRTGRYRRYPIAGLALTSVALVLLSGMDEQIPL